MTPNQPAPDLQVLAPPKPKRRWGLGVLVVLLLLAAAGAGWWYLQPKAAPISTLGSPSPAAKAATETISHAFSADYASGVGKAASANLSLAAPTTWRTQTTVDSPSTCSANGGNQPDPCFSFTFANALGSPTSVAATNQLDVYNLSGWRTYIGGNGADQLYYFAGLTDAKDKDRAIKATEALKPDTKLTPEMVRKTLLNPFVVNAALMGMSNPQYLESVDGSMHGYAFIATLAQDQEYLPVLYTVLVGERGGATLLLAGEFRLNDQRRAHLPDTKDPFWDAYKDGYQYPADTTAMADEAVRVVRSVRLVP
jgi:hypothetical protein